MSEETLLAFERINELLDYYGALLTDNQKSMMEAYYRYDLSLSEISEQFSISRTAVSDALKTSIKKLEHYEATLSLVKSQHQLQEKLQKIKEADAPIKAKLIDALLEELAHGI